MIWEGLQHYILLAAHYIMWSLIVCHACNIAIRLCHNYVPPTQNVTPCSTALDAGSTDLLAHSYVLTSSTSASMTQAVSQQMSASVSVPAELLILSMHLYFSLGFFMEVELMGELQEIQLT